MRSFYVIAGQIPAPRSGMSFALTTKKFWLRKPPLRILRKEFFLLLRGTLSCPKRKQNHWPWNMPLS